MVDFQTCEYWEISKILVSDNLCPCPFPVVVEVGGGIYYPPSSPLLLHYGKSDQATDLCVSEAKYRE